MEDTFMNVVITKNYMVISYIKDTRKIYQFLLMKHPVYYNIKMKIF